MASLENKPLLLGHRGCRDGGVPSAKPRENSLAAFEYALTAGCDGFEFDVRHTQDRRNVLWHDPEWGNLKIAYTDGARLEDGSGKRPATFEEALESFGHRAYLDIELKAPGNEAAVVAALKQTPPQRGFVVSSFRPAILFRVRLLDSSVPLGFICDRKEFLPAWRSLPLRMFLPERKLVTQELIAEAHSRGVQVMTWTVNDSSTMRQLAEWGIDGIISDDPQLLYQTFHSA